MAKSNEKNNETKLNKIYYTLTSSQTYLFKMTQNEKNAVFLVLTIIGIIGLIMGISSFEAELIIFYLIWSGIFGFLYYRGKKNVD